MKKNQISKIKNHKLKTIKPFNRLKIFKSFMVIRGLGEN